MHLQVEVVCEVIAFFEQVEHGATPPQWTTLGDLLQYVTDGGVSYSTPPVRSETSRTPSRF